MKKNSKNEELSQTQSQNEKEKRKQNEGNVKEGKNVAGIRFTFTNIILRFCFWFVCCCFILCFCFA